MKNKMKKQNIKNIFNYIVIVLLPIFTIIHFYKNDINKYSDILFVGLFFILNYFYKKNSEHRFDKRVLILSFIYALIYVYGTIIDKNNVTHYGILTENTLINIIYVYSFTIPIYYVMKTILKKLCNLNEYKEKTCKKNYILPVFFILFFTYFVYFISLAPGMLSPDSIAQIYQALGLSELSNHHPVFHTLYIKLCLYIGNVFGNINAGIVIYSLSQMAIMSMIFTYLIYFLQKNNCSKYIIYFTILFYTIIPVFGIYSVTMWKDILFGGFALLFMIQIYKYIDKKELSNIDKFLIIISTILTSLFRSNGIFVCILITITLLIFNKEKRKATIYLYLIPCLIVILITGPIYNTLNIKKGNLVESLSIPLEQLSNLVKEDLELDKETTEYIENLVGRDVIKNEYVTYSIDSVKFNENFDNKYLEENKVEFFKIWLKNLVKYPMQYCETYLKSTYGFWYIEAKGYSAHIWEIDTNNIFGLKTYHDTMPKIVFHYHEKMYNLPILKYFMEPAIFLMALIFIIFSIIITKSKKYIYPVLVPLCVWITIMMATPVSYQSRYVFTLFTTFPLIIFLIYDIYSKNKNLGENYEKDR